MNWFKKYSKDYEIPDDHHELDYHVKVENYEAGEYDLVFDSREQARLYKKCLRNSRRQLIAHIIKRQYSGDFISEEVEVF